jgi:hypothetical protein
MGSGLASDGKVRDSPPEERAQGAFSLAKGEIRQRGSSLQTESFNGFQERVTQGKKPLQGDESVLFDTSAIISQAQQPIAVDNLGIRRFSYQAKSLKCQSAMIAALH